MAVGERQKYAGKKFSLNRVSNSQPPDYESDTLTTEPPGLALIQFKATADDKRTSEHEIFADHRLNLTRNIQFSFIRLKCCFPVSSAFPIEFTKGFSLKVPSSCASVHFLLYSHKVFKRPGGGGACPWVSTDQGRGHVPSCSHQIIQSFFILNFRAGRDSQPLNILIYVHFKK